MKVAFFDLDETIISLDSDYAWAKFMTKKKFYQKTEYFKLGKKFKQDYIDGKLDIVKYHNFVGSYLGKYSMKQLFELREEYIKTNIKPFILSKAVSKINEHKKNGNFNILISATNSFLVNRIGKEFNFDHIIATNLIIKNNHFIGKIKGIASFNYGKVKRVQEWIKQNPIYSLTGSWFYSDSFNDLPLLELVDNPVAIDPDKTLKKYATKKGWKIQSFR